MRQETITKTYLKFDELSKEQQEKVLDNLRFINVEHDYWYECTKEQFHNDLNTLGFYNIESQFSGFWSQGDGASFSANFDLPESETDLQERVDKLLKNAPYFFHTPIEVRLAEKSANWVLASLAQDFLNLDFSEELEHGEEKIAIEQHGRYCHEYTMDCWNEELKEFSRSLAVRYYTKLENEYNYLTSDEAIKDTIESNDYEFDSDTLKIV